MDGKGRWADNVFIERFWRSLKHEHVYLYAFDTIQEGRKLIGQFMDLYNHKRLHQSLNYRIPGEVYAALLRENSASYGLDNFMGSGSGFAATQFEQPISNQIGGNGLT